MKIAILHEMLIKLGGAEKVVETLINIFPSADLYTLIYDEKQVGNIFPKNMIHQSCKKLHSQKIYTTTKKQRLCLPFMRRSVESLDFSQYDYVIVSSSGFAHRLKTGENTKTIVYYHAPARYMWDWAHEYRKEIRMNRGIKGYLYGTFMKSLRIGDYHAAQNNDVLLANSHTTQKRIWKYYRRESTLVFPPIETQRFAKKAAENSQNFFSGEDYYIILSALTEFKRLDVAIRAFQKLPNNNLLIIGAGEYKSKLQEISGNSKNIVFAGAQYGDKLVSIVQDSLGLIFPGEEDFGIVPIEVMAAGKPVFALAKGGLTETVLAGKTGEFFEDSEGIDFTQKFQIFHKNNIALDYSPQACKKQAQKYDISEFEKHIKSCIQAG